LLCGRVVYWLSCQEDETDASVYIFTLKQAPVVQYVSEEFELKLESRNALSHGESSDRLNKFNKPRHTSSQYLDNRHAKTIAHIKMKALRSWSLPMSSPSNLENLLPKFSVGLDT
ncbi:hypothetical protein FRX31_016262, partial [Thalictrum thalictroides]